MLKELLLYISVSILVSLVVYPIVRYLSLKFNLVDMPGERKVHKNPTPRTGGVIIFLGFIVSYILSQRCCGFFKNVFDGVNSLGEFSLLGFIIAACSAFALGLVDDIIGISAKFKLLIQILIGVVVAVSGFKITSINVVDYVINFGFFSYVLTVIWVVAFFNAVNFIDGLDGLAAGIVAIALGFTALLAGIEGKYFITFVSSILCASTLVFLIFNFNPAKIFMGDGGSYFLGCIYAMLSLMGTKKTTMAIMFAIPLVLLLIPLVDIVYIVVRRAKKKQDVFKADKNHLHHRLLSLGLSVRQITVLVYLVCISFGLISLLIVLTGGQYGFIFFLLVMCLVSVGFGVIRILEKKS